LDTSEPPPSAALLSAEEAKRRLRKIVEEFFFRRGRQGETAARHLLVRSPPGLGKTKEAMEWATRYQAEQDAAPLLEICLDDVTEGGAIAQTAVFVPRHALALEIKEVIESNLAARGRPVAVQILRGRDHRAEHYEAPCQRWREAGELGRKGLPVYRQLARTNVEHAEVLEAEIVACRHGRPCSFLSSTV
jgi:hypothetical protein